jgi:chitin synthase
MGDDLNVIPETFKGAAKAPYHPKLAMPLLPPDKIEGRFAAAERLPNGWYKQPTDSMISIDPVATLGFAGEQSNQRRSSFDSNSNHSSVFTPRRVESLMGEEDRRKYALAQANQRLTGSSPTPSLLQIQVSEMAEAEMRKEGFRESVDPFGSPTSSGETSPEAMAFSPAVHGHRLSSGVRTTVRSPLARMSIERLEGEKSGEEDRSGT